MSDNALSSWPSFTKEEQETVSAVLQSNKVNYWTGDIGRSFEREFAAWTNVKHAVALANGTLALDLALKGLDIGPGDEVVVTPRTFIASVSSVVNCGATPVFADVDNDSGNITAATIAAVLTEKSRAIVPVHLGGWPCDMGAIMALAESHDIVVIEDCAQAHGAMVGQKMVGSIGHAAAWSFCQDKIMTTGGEGGMVTTNDPLLWDRMWSYKDHGKSWEAVYDRKHPPGFRWLHDNFGTNWRMLEMQAAIGRIQLKRMEKWTARRTLIANTLGKTLEFFPSAVRSPSPDKSLTHAYYRQYGYINDGGLKAGWNRDQIIADIVEQGYPAFQGSCSEVYLEKAFNGTGWQPEKRLPVARNLGQTSIMFLTHPTITDGQLERYCAAIHNSFERASS